MDLAVDLISWVLLLAGSVFSLIGAVGIIRLPDVVTRMPGAGVVETLGVGLILVGLMVQAGLTLVTVKLILIIAFLFYTSPAATHALARAALTAGVEPLLGKSGDGEDEASKT